MMSLLDACSAFPDVEPLWSSQLVLPYRQAVISQELTSLNKGSCRHTAKVTYILSLVWPCAAKLQQHCFFLSRQ